MITRCIVSVLTIALGWLVVPAAWAQLTLIPHIPNVAGNFRTEIIGENHGHRPVVFRLTPYLADGEAREPVSFSLAVSEVRARMVTELFPGVDVSHILIEGGGTEAAVSVGYRFDSTFSSRADSPASTRQASRWRFFPGDWSSIWDGVAVVNTGTTSAAVDVLQIGGDGGLIRQHSLGQLAPMAKATLAVGGSGVDLFESVPGHYFEIRADQPLALYVMRGTDNPQRGIFLWTVPARALPPASEQPVTWSERLMPAPHNGNGHTPAADFARAHGAVRLFTPDGDRDARDGLLATLLDEHHPADAMTWRRYAAADPAMALIPSEEEHILSPAQVEMLNGVALLTPGTGQVSIPEEAAAIAIDLWQLPNQPVAVEATRRALTAALAEDSTLGIHAVRQFSGFPDQRIAANVYDSDIVEIGDRLQGEATIRRPVALLVGPRLPPAVAAMAAGLRLNGQAWLIGHPIPAQLTESSLSPLPHSNLAWRGGVRRFQDGRLWPDLIDADILTPQPLTELTDLASRGPPPLLNPSTANRPDITPYDSTPADAAGLILSRGERLTMLMVAHGVLQQFYPYFDIVGDSTDEALTTGLERLLEIAPDDRRSTLRELGRFMHVIRDGHGFYFDDRQSRDIQGFAAVQLESIDGLPVVRASADPRLGAGDIIIERNGQAIDEWIAAERLFHSAATEGYLTDLVFRELVTLERPTLYRLRDTAGITSEVAPFPQNDFFGEIPGRGGVLRPSGMLNDLDAADVLYLNLGNSVTSPTQIRELVDSFPQATGLIADMRDFPAGLNVVELATLLRGDGVSSPRFGFPTYTGPDQFSIIDQSFEIESDPDAYTGPLVLLVSYHTVSSAEFFSQLLTFQRPATLIVGQQSAATNGNITNAILPGGLRMTFTGMRIRWPDGRDFHATGLLPDIEVPLSPAAFAQGSDPELEAALAALNDL